MKSKFIVIFYKVELLVEIENGMSGTHMGATYGTYTSYC